MQANIILRFVRQYKRYVLHTYYRTLGRYVLTTAE